MEHGGTLVTNVFSGTYGGSVLGAGFPNAPGINRRRIQWYPTF